MAKKNMTILLLIVIKMFTKKRYIQNTKTKALLISALLYCFVFILCENAFGAIWYVASDVSNSGNGTSWSEAFKSIQEAVDVSDPVNNDEIWVKQGIYLLSAQINVNKAVNIYGGFAGWETQRDQRDWRANATIVDGDNNVRCFSMSSQATIDGITIRNGSTEGKGGAIFTTARLTINNCIFSGNISTSGGGAISDGYNSGTPYITITNSKFFGNTSENGSGGAIYIWYGYSTKIINCSFFGNTAVSGGGVFHNIPFGGLYGPSFTNCTFFNNSASSKGGGVYLYTSTSMSRYAKIQNSVFWGNNAPSQPEIAKYYDFSLSVTYSDIQGGFAGDGNIDADPIFADAEGRLSYGSPCIDAGTNNANDLLQQDIDGRPRVVDGDGNGTSVVDMGAYEYVIKVTSPDGGEFWWEDDLRNITWISSESEIGDLVKIEISRDSGSNWSTLVNSTENDGSYEWEVTGPASYSCLVRVSSVNHPSVTDSSDADFKIEADSDSDGMGDFWEMQNFGNLDRDGTLDWDGDGLNDKGEFDGNTDPKDTDTDDDGMWDGWEVLNSLNPLANDAFDDADADGFCNLREYIGGTNPEDPESTPTAPIIIHVDVGNTSGTEDGNKLHPFNTIQEAVDLASEITNDEIWVRQGTYYLSSTIILDKAVLLFGGFTGDEVKRDDRDWHANVTIVDGQGSVICFDVRADAVIDGLVIENGKGTYGGGISIRGGSTDASSPIITNSTFSNNTALYGGAIHAVYAQPVIINCTFSTNTATENGGAIHTETASSDISDCTFDNNTAGFEGGAVSNDGGWGTTTTRITDCTFSRNTSDDNGGAIYNHKSSGTISNCEFSENKAEHAGSGGGAIYNGSSQIAIDACIFFNNFTSRGGGAVNNSDSPSTTITNCIFNGNSSDYCGGAIWNWQSQSASGPNITNCTLINNITKGSGGGISNSWSAPKVTNCTFYNNSAEEKGGGIHNGGHTYLGESPIITNCILWGDNAPEGPEISNYDSYPKVTYCDVQGGYTGSGNTNSDPKFVDVENANFHLQNNSPCIDKGSNSAPELPETDFDGEARIQDGNGDGIAIVDIGADEYVRLSFPPPIPGTVTPFNTQYSNFVDSPFDLSTTFTNSESDVTSCEYCVSTDGTCDTEWATANLSGTSPMWTCTKTEITGTNGQVLTLNMRATSSGGTGTATAITRTIDSLPPTTTDNSTSTWTSTSPVTVTLSPNEGSGSGVASTKYCVDMANTCTPSNTGTSANVTCASGLECTQYVRYFSTDNVGNTETTKSSNQIRQDRKTPVDGTTFAATAGNGQCNLAWSPATDSASGLNTVDAYKLVYLTGATPPNVNCTDGIDLTAVTTGTTYNHTGLTNGTQYSYRVCAYDSVNNISTGITASCKPQAPDITVTPATINFGSVNVGSMSSPQTGMVSNDGMADLEIGTIEITGTDASEFIILNDACSGQTLEPSGTCRLDVRFSPKSEAPERFSMLGYFRQSISLLTPKSYKQKKSGILNIPSNDPDTPTLEVPLSGKGYATMMQRILDIQKVWQRSLFPSGN